jgi:hypothetical protein
MATLYATQCRQLCRPVVTWLDDSELVYISETDRPTYDKGNVLDLAFASGHLALAGAKSIIAHHLDATSDHRPLLTTIPWDQRFREPSRKLRFHTLGQSLFLYLLTSNLAGLELLATTEECLCLDSLATGLTSAIHNAYEGAAKRALGQRTGQPWWNADCNTSRQLYRSGNCTSKELRKTVRSAQRQY